MELLKLFAVHLGIWFFVIVFSIIFFREKIEDNISGDALAGVHILLASMSFAIHWGLS